MQVGVGEDLEKYRKATATPIQTVERESQGFDREMHPVQGCWPLMPKLLRKDL